MTLRQHSSVKTKKQYFCLVSDEEKVVQMLVTFSGKSGKPDAYVKKVIKEKKRVELYYWEGQKNI